MCVMEDSISMIVLLIKSSFIYSYIPLHSYICQSIHPSACLCTYTYLLTKSLYLVAVPKRILMMNTCEALWPLRATLCQPTAHVSPI